ncbi:hypothetical protein [Streptomyces sp. HNM0574]|uniref:hypothetical protein n=1 Tax=Streptomyces sp. HNM0574 TaxID=2714954 RepID=UPI00146D520B|nr:hypothetical protein [Streptomyces sp. HNM0574]
MSTQDEQSRKQAPEPEPIRFYGTTWVDHSGGYPLRRLGLGLGALAAAVAGAFVLRLAYDGLAIADVGSWVTVLVVVAFAVCSSLAFSRTLGGYLRRDDDGAAAADSSLRSVKAIGFIGVLAAYALRTVVEAPGEKLLRAEYEAELERYEKRRTSRTGNPAAKRKRGGRTRR